MMFVREASAHDGRLLIDFLRATPLQAGTEFVLDRSPDFSALLRLRGSSRTFLAFARERLAGTVTALWHDAREGTGQVRVGEVVDLRVAEWAHGTPATARLLGAAREAFAAANVQWATCVIGDRNCAAMSLVRGAAGLPRLEPLSRYASVHYVVCRTLVPPPPRAGGRFTVRSASAIDAADLEALVEETSAHRRFAPLQPLRWPDTTGRHRAWIARDAGGAPAAALIVWDGFDLRRIRVVRYRGADRTLRIASVLASRCGLATALPPEGGALRLWASRWLPVRDGRRDAARALIRAALRDALAEHVHVVQMNLAADDPLLSALPRHPRSTYWSTLYGCELVCRSAEVLTAERGPYYLELALV